MDHVDVSTRSRIMRTIGAKNTGPELILRRYLHSRGYRFRLHKRNLPGKPDLVLSRYRLVIFVHGCYWHRHSGCILASTPKSNAVFWKIKFFKNVVRDRRQQQELKIIGWRVLVVWQCGLRYCQGDLGLIENLIKGMSIYAEWPENPPKSIS